MTKNAFDKKDIEHGWVPPLSNDKGLLSLRINFFKNQENETMKYVTQSYEDFISAFEKSIEANKSITIKGLDTFVQKDVIVGCNHFIDQLIMTYGLNGIQQFGGYNYYKRLDANVQNATLETLDKEKPLIMEYPFPSNGGPHKQHNEIIEKCNQLGIDVYLDCAWLPVSWDMDLDLSQSCIKGMAISLSKCYGLHWSRIGVRWLKNSTHDSIFLQNKHKMISFPSVMLGKYYLDRLPMDYLVDKYKQKYYDMCEYFEHTAGNTIMISHSNDKQEIYGIANCLLKNNEKN